MKRFAGIVLMIIGLVLFVSSISNVFYGHQINGNKELTKTLGSYKRMQFSSRATDWNMKTYEGDELIVRLQDGRRHEHVVMKERGDELKIEVVEKNFHFFDFSFFGRRPIIDVHIPEHYQGDLRVTTTSGDLTIYNVEVEDAIFKSVSGDIHTVDLLGDDITMETVSGDIEVGKINAEKATIKTTSGDLFVTQLKGELDVKSVSGDIEIEFENENEELKVVTTSGDIDVRIPSPNATISLKTTSGDLHVAPQLEEQTMEKRKVFGKIGEGLHSIELTTTSGDIRIY